MGGPAGLERIDAGSVGRRSVPERLLARLRRHAHRRTAPVGRTRPLRVAAARPAPHCRTRHRSHSIDPGRLLASGRFHVKHRPSRSGCRRDLCRTHAPCDPCLLRMGRHRERSQWHRMAMRAGRQETKRRRMRPASGPHYRRAASLRLSGWRGHVCPPDESSPTPPAGTRRPRPRVRDGACRHSWRTPSRAIRAVRAGMPWPLDCWPPAATRDGSRLLRPYRQWFCGPRSWPMPVAVPRPGLPVPARARRALVVGVESSRSASALPASPFSPSVISFARSSLRQRSGPNQPPVRTALAVVPRRHAPARSR
jgi:hypothetical protein